jgi:hypothetical protein
VVLTTGKPLTKGTIYFEPVSAPGLKASGKIQPDGTYSLTTYQEGDGAVEGEHRVYLVLDDGQASESRAGQKKGRSTLLLQFTDPDSSGIKVHVKPGTNQLDPIVLKPALAAR